MCIIQTGRGRHTPEDVQWATRTRHIGGFPFCLRHFVPVCGMYLQVKSVSLFLYVGNVNSFSLTIILITVCLFIFSNYFLLKNSINQIVLITYLINFQVTFFWFSCAKSEADEPPLVRASTNGSKKERSAQNPALCIFLIGTFLKLVSSDSLLFIFNFN